MEPMGFNFQRIFPIPRSDGSSIICEKLDPNPTFPLCGDANVNTKRGNSCVIRFGHNDVINGQKGMRYW